MPALAEQLHALPGAELHGQGERRQVITADTLAAVQAFEVMAGK